MTDTKEPRTTPKKKKVVSEMPFEETMARLEVIVKAMEGDAVSLDESLALYEEGVTLVRRLHRELDEAEQRVSILQKTADGEIKPAPFATVEE